MAGAWGGAGLTLSDSRGRRSPGAPPAGGGARPGTGCAPGHRAPGLPGLARRGLPLLWDGRPRRMAARLPCTAIPGRRLAAPVAALGAGAWPAQRGPHPPAPGCRWLKERTRPWSVVAVAEKPGRTVLSRVWLAGGGRGMPAGAAPPGVPGCGPHPARAPPPGPLGITRLGAPRGARCGQRSRWCPPRPALLVGPPRAWRVLARHDMAGISGL